MPELIILISAVACIGSVVVLYFNGSNAATTGIAVISFIGFLYGIGQRVERDNVEARSLGIGDAAERRVAQNTGVNDGGWWKPSGIETAAPDKAKKVEAPAQTPAPVQRRVEVVPENPARQLPLSPPNQLNALGPGSPASLPVVISNYTAKITGTRFVEVSGKVTNLNGFPIKNIVVKCGDKTYASADVSATVEKIVPANSDAVISGVRMGPIRPHLPPTTCLIAKFDRAD